MAISKIENAYEKRLTQSKSQSDKSRLDKLRRAFERAASDYDAHAFLNNLIADRLLENLQLFDLKPSVIVELGAATGYSGVVLRKTFPSALLIESELSEAMLTLSRERLQNEPLSAKQKWQAKTFSSWRNNNRFLCCDSARLPLADKSVELIYSSLHFHWFGELDEIFQECRRVLKPTGLVLFSTFGPDTLRELRQAYAETSSAAHINTFFDMHDIGDAMIRAGFSGPVMESDALTINYNITEELLNDIRGIGSINLSEKRNDGLSTRSKRQALAEAYTRNAKGEKLPATFEIVYGHAWCPDRDTRKQDGSTVSTFPLEALTRKTEKQENLTPGESLKREPT